MPCAISIQSLETSERADSMIGALHAGADEVPRFHTHDIVPMLYQGDDMDDGRRAMAARLATIDPAWQEYASVL